MARKLPALCCLTLLFGLFSWLPNASASPPGTSQEAPLVPAHEYRARSMAALEAGKARLAGQILMLSYQEHGDTEALYIAGMVFSQAGDKAMAWQVWSVFLCNSTNGARRREVRLALHNMTPKRPPMKCLRPGTSAVHEPLPAPAASHQANQGPQRLATQRLATQRLATERHYTPKPVAGTASTFELEAGLSVGDDAFALTWGPGMWFGDQAEPRFGLFVPIMLGEKFKNNATIGLEPRLRMPVNSSMSAELAAGLHTGEHPRYSVGVGLNFSEAFTVGISHEGLLDRDEFDDSYTDASGTFLNATFTGKTGKTATIIEAALVLLIVGLAAGG